MRGITLIGKKELSKEKYTTYNKPQYIYIPLILGNDTDLTVLVKKNDYVCKGEIVARKKGPMTLPIFSSVSGTVIDFEEHLYHNNQMVKCIKIENDLKERVQEPFKTRETINNISKEEFREILKNSGIMGMGGAGFPTYIKYQAESIKTLIVNAVECEPYITADEMLLKQKTEQILEAIDAIMEINKIEECIIAIKKHNKNLIKQLKNYLGTYVHIKIVGVPNKYPMGWERSLVQYCKNVDYDKLPIEKGIIINNVSTIYAIYQALKTNKPLIERIVTVTGEMVKQPTNVLVRIGTKVEDLITTVGGLKRNKDIICIMGGPMMGYALASSDAVITADVNCILVMKYQEELKEATCMRCSKCALVCPARIYPVLIKDVCHDKEALKSLNPEKCISCGLCSYICPAKIKVRDYVNIAKETMRKGR